MPETREVFRFAPATLTASTVLDTWIPDFNGEITDVTAQLNTVGTATTTIVDIRKNGTTIYSASPDIRPTFAISASGLSVPAAWANNTSYSVGQRVTVSAAQVGESLPQSEGYGTPGTYQCLVAHTSPAAGGFVTAPSGGYGSGTAPTGIAGTPLWVELAGPQAPFPAVGSAAALGVFKQGDVITCYGVQVGTSAAGLVMDVEYVPE